MAPAGKTRQKLRFTRQYNSSIEIQDGTNIRSRKLGLAPSVKLHPSQKEQLRSQINELKQSKNLGTAKNPNDPSQRASDPDRKQGPILPRRFGSLHSHSNLSVDQGLNEIASGYAVVGPDHENTPMKQQEILIDTKNEKSQDEVLSPNLKQDQNSLLGNDAKISAMKGRQTSLQEIHESQSDSAADEEPAVVPDLSLTGEKFNQKTMMTEIGKANKTSNSNNHR